MRGVVLAAVNTINNTPKIKLHASVSSSSQIRGPDSKYMGPKPTQAYPKPKFYSTFLSPKYAEYSILFPKYW